MMLLGRPIHVDDRVVPDLDYLAHIRHQIVVAQHQQHVARIARYRQLMRHLTTHPLGTDPERDEEIRHAWQFLKPWPQAAITDPGRPR